MTGNFNRAPWVNNTNVYEVNIRQYTPEGTFDAFENHLPRLRNMGIKTLWFMPITPIAEKGKKGILGSPYACSDYTSVNPEFGELDDFVSLVTHAQRMGFKVIIDWVANHTGWDHTWTRTHPEYYKHDDQTGTFKVASGMDDIIELDYNSAALRDAMIAAMKFWIDTAGIDGFRCDLASWVPLDFWIQARTELEKTKNLFWLAEADVIESAPYLQVFDAAYSWKWMHKTEEFYKQRLSLQPLDALLLQYGQAAGKDALTLWFTSNHDENSWNGTEYEKYGNIALPLAIHSFTWDGLPLIYSGQELPNLKRLHFFEKDSIAWEGPLGMTDFYKRLLTLRKNNPALMAADDAVKILRLSINDYIDQKLLGYLRKKGTHEVLVLLNLSAATLDFNLSDGFLDGSYRNVLDDTPAFQGHELKAWSLEPWAYCVYEKM